MWEVDALDSLLYYARLPGATPEVAKAIRERFLPNLSRASEAFTRLSAASRSLSRSDRSDYTWGSNKGKAMQARLYQLAALYNTDPRLSEICARRGVGIRSLYPRRESARPRLSDEYGPGWRQSFCGDHVSYWFAYGTRWQRVTEQLPGPPPGFLVGGPNPQFSIDACCRAPPGSPGYRCYGATDVLAVPSRILRRRWRSRRPSRIFSSMTRGRRTRGRSRSLHCTINLTMSGCLPHLPSDAAFYFATSRLRLASCMKTRFSALSFLMLE